MKVKVFPLSIPFLTEPLSEWKDSWDVQLYIKLEDEESYGWGEALIAGSGIINSYLGVLEDVIIPIIEKMEVSVSSPAEFRSLLEKMLFSAGNCGVVSGAISAVEMALWGLKAKKEKKSLSELLGGKKRDKVKVYASFPRFNRLDDVIKATENSLKKGFEIIKLHQPPSSVLESVKAIRERFREVKIAIDLNSPFNLNDAIDFVNKIHRYEIEWVEEPLWPPNDYDLLSRLTRVSPIAIAAGENEYSLYGFKKLIESGITYLQPDVAKIGGVSKFLDVLDLASSYKVKVAPHDRPDSSPVSLIYTLNLGLVRPEIEVIEYPIVDFPKDLFSSLPTLAKGYVTPPDNVEVNESAVDNYKYIKKVRILHFSDLEKVISKK